ncbi:MAG TPA: hypothetical protein VG797_03625 [Phycisphaerales bacterium]|nr:hypothetical protein [Phycisphaerales bacterium]
MVVSACAKGPEWREAEKGILTDYVQLTERGDFLRAGEQYFSPDANWIIFQAIPVPKEGQSPDEVYSMYVAKVKKNGAGDRERIVGIEKPLLLSPPGSANTCGYFHPKEPWNVIFGSTLVKPSGQASGGYQRGTSRYRWAFPDEMDVVQMMVPAIWESIHAPAGDRSVSSIPPTPVFSRTGYDAECAYSPDGRFIVHASVDPETHDSDIFVYDTKTKDRTPVVTAKGYDGGPFFSPNGKMICYRSDRAGNDLLQVYIADLVFADGGAITGSTNERAVTANEHVNWAPYWHPSGEYLIYATSEMGHDNYEVFAIEAPIGASARKSPSELKKKRVTHAPGFDGLPVFSTDGRWMAWSSQRGPKVEGEERPSTQVWAARVVGVKP